MKFTKKLLILVTIIVALGGLSLFGPLKKKPEASQDGSSALPAAAKVSVITVEKTPLLRKGFEENSTIEAIERVVVYPVSYTISEPTRPY
mgnify:CR=1 FL=1